MGNISDLKTRLADVPGIETLTLTLIGGRQVFGFAGLIAAVDPLATDQEIEDAIRNAAEIAKFGRGASASMTHTNVAASMAPATLTKGVKPMSITGAGAAGLSLKALIEAQKAKIANDLKANMAKIQEGFDKQNAAVAAVGNLGDKVHAEADDLMASVGQFSNDMGLE